MKKIITLILIALSGIMILDSLNAGEALFMFVLAGIVPGTSLSISGTTMLALFGGLIGFVLSRIVARITFAAKQSTQTA